MKKLFLLLLSSILLMQFGTSAMAESADDIPIQNEDILTESADFAGVKKLEKEMLEGLKRMYDEAELPSDFPEHMDYSKAVKIYVDTGIQDFGTDKETEIIKNLEQSNFVWIIPMVIGGENVRVTVARGLPLNEERASILTEEERKEIRSQEGKWTVTEYAVGIGEPFLSQIQDHKDVLKDCDHVVLVGGVPGLREPAALGFQDGKAVGWMSLGYQYPIIEDTPAARSRTDGLYDFNTVMEASQEYANSLDNTSGGGGAIVEKEPPVSIFIVAVPVVVIAVIVGIIVMKEKRRMV